MLGDEDVFIEQDDHRYSTSCECISRTAEVFEVKQDDYLRECKKQPHWQEIIDAIREKSDKFAQRVITKNVVQKTFDEK